MTGDGLPELKARVDRMIHGRETTPPECEEAGFQSRLVYRLVYKRRNPRHSSLNTTQVYLSVTANHLEEAIGLLD